MNLHITMFVKFRYTTTLQQKTASCQLLDACQFSQSYGSPVA